MNQGMEPVGLRAIILSIAFALLCGLSSAAIAADANPLRPPDTSSPRGTIEGFIKAVDDIYLISIDVYGEYAASGRLYLNADERRKEAGMLRSIPAVIQYFDLSQIPPILKNSVAVERALQLKEILDRIEVPAASDIPNREAMAQSGSKRWRLPDTEIEVALIENGPRAGEYLISAETVDRLPEFYERVKDLPYKPGPAKDLIEIYHTLASERVTTLYDARTSSPIGLDRIIPIRWMLRWPDWVRTRIFRVAVWQWLGLAFGFFVAVILVSGVYRAGRRFTKRDEDGRGPRWHSLLAPVVIILLAAYFVPLLCLILRIGGTIREAIAFLSTSVLYFSAAWLAVVGTNALGEAVISSEHLRQSSLDSQLIRLGMRLFGIILAVGLLIQGAYELGFPAYSVLAGLGVGGLAVALAAQHSLANLLGSLLIMVEKPFRVGHSIRVAGSEGTVEAVGFRSTRIRTADNSLISIPSNSVVNATIENLTLRTMRHQRLLLQVAYDTPHEKLKAFIASIERLIKDHPLTNKSKYDVRFSNLAESSLEILVNFHLNVSDSASELKAREEILFEIMERAADLGVEFSH
ncbi:MAG TPA: mechanosensitive ion channel family protein [Alphaproteobacteria bacterium]|nr:mechanosensitive ion channel family protein [Alphaproteobacteria bacterium]